MSQVITFPLSRRSIAPSCTKISPVQYAATLKAEIGRLAEKVCRELQTFSDTHFCWDLFCVDIYKTGERPFASYHLQIFSLESDSATLSIGHEDGAYFLDFGNHEFLANDLSDNVVVSFVAEGFVEEIF